MDADIDDLATILNASESGIGGTAADLNEKKKNLDPLKDLLIGSKHPLIGIMSNNKTRFFIVKAPSNDYIL